MVRANAEGEKKEPEAGWIAEWNAINPYGKNMVSLW